MGSSEQVLQGELRACSGLRGDRCRKRIPGASVALGPCSAGDQEELPVLTSGSKRWVLVGCQLTVLARG